MQRRDNEKCQLFVFLSRLREIIGALNYEAPQIDQLRLNSKLDRPVFVARNSHEMNYYFVTGRSILTKLRGIDAMRNKILLKSMPTTHLTAYKLTSYYIYVLESKSNYNACEENNVSRI